MRGLEHTLHFHRTSEFTSVAPGIFTLWPHLWQMRQCNTEKNDLPLVTLCWAESSPEQSSDPYPCLSLPLSTRFWVLMPAQLQMSSAHSAQLCDLRHAISALWTCFINVLALQNPDGISFIPRVLPLRRPWVRSWSCEDEFSSSLPTSRNIFRAQGGYRLGNLKWGENSRNPSPLSGDPEIPKRSQLREFPSTHWPPFKKALWQNVWAQKQKD